MQPILYNFLGFKCEIIELLYVQVIGPKEGNKAHFVVVLVSAFHVGKSCKIVLLGISPHRNGP
jgi:hypothetical protein